MRPSGPRVAVTDGGYVQVEYDSVVGRQVYYTATSGVAHHHQQQQMPPQLQGIVGGEMRHVGSGEQLAPKVKIVTTKVSQASM